MRLPLPSVPDSLELQARGIRQEEAAEPQSIPGAWSEVQHEGDTNPGIWDSFGPRAGFGDVLFLLKSLTSTQTQGRGTLGMSATGKLWENSLEKE